MTLEDRLNKIETLLMALIGRQETKWCDRNSPG